MLAGGGMREADEFKDNKTGGIFLFLTCYICYVDYALLSILQKIYFFEQWMRSSPMLTANAEVATVLGSIQAVSDKVKSEGRQMKQC